MRGLAKALAALSCGAALLLTGCIDVDLGGIADRYREDFHYSYPLSAGGTIQLDTFNGSVEITGWDKDLVEIDGTKYANSEQRLKEIKIDISPESNAITIRTTRPLERFGNAGAGDSYARAQTRRAIEHHFVERNGSRREHQRAVAPEDLERHHQSVAPGRLARCADFQWRGGGFRCFGRCRGADFERQRSRRSA